MIAYTGIETVSNLAEEARDPRALDPARDLVGRDRGLRDLLHAAVHRALGDAGRAARAASTSRSSARTRRTASRTTRCSGSSRTSGCTACVAVAAKVYVGILAATILFIATNAGVIGASRITYSMASYRQLPEVFRRLHPKLKTPWLSLLVFAGIGPTIFLLSGQVDFLGRMYAFGAMLSFTIAHASVIALRVRQRDDELEWRARPNLRIRGIDWPLFAIVGGFGTGAAWLVVVVQDAPTRYAASRGSPSGSSSTPLYRRRLQLPLAQTARAPVPLGPALALEYRSILVPIVAGRRVARGGRGRGAARHRARRRASSLLRVIVVPLELPLDADLTEQVEEANDLLDEAHAIARALRRADHRARRPRAPRRAARSSTRPTGADRRSSCSARRAAATGAIFGHTVDYVLKHAPCRVMVAAGRKVPA